MKAVTAVFVLTPSGLDAMAATSSVVVCTVWDNDSAT
jgi:hypothetical protein